MPKTQDDLIRERLGMITQAMIDELDDQEELAKFQNIVYRMVHRKPFFASLLSRMKIHTGRAALKYAPTACVWVGHDLQVHMAVNPFCLQRFQREEFKRGLGELTADQVHNLVRQGFKVFLPSDSVTEEVAKLIEKNNQPLKRPTEWLAMRKDHDMQVALLIHECMHVIQRHCLLGTSDKFPDQQVTNIAMDIAINQFIADKSDNWLDLDTYASWGLILPPNKDFSYYYKEIKELFKGRKRGSPPPQEPAQEEEEKQRNAVHGLTHGTQISTPRGFTPIQDLNPGDTVYSLDAKNKLVQRLVVHTKMGPMIAEKNDPKQAQTQVFSMATSSHGFGRVSSKVKVRSATRGWIGIGEATMNQPGKLKIGEEITVFPSNNQVNEKVVTLEPITGRTGDRLYQLLVQSGDTTSSFFANGLLVRGLQAVKVS